MAYSKQTWVRGEKVASTKLNHMEDGIAAISANGAIDTANLANASVTNEKLDQEAVDSNNIRAGAINTPLIYDGAVTSDKIANGAIGTEKLADGAISYPKLNAELKGKVDAFDALGLSVVDGMLCVTYSE